MTTTTVTDQPAWSDFDVLARLRDHDRDTCPSCSTGGEPATTCNCTVRCTFGGCRLATDSTR